jgi:hypothetical protein
MLARQRKTLPHTCGQELTMTRIFASVCRAKGEVFAFEKDSPYPDKGRVRMRSGVGFATQLPPSPADEEAERRDRFVSKMG